MYVATVAVVVVAAVVVVVVVVAAVAAMVKRLRCRRQEVLGTHHFPHEEVVPCHVDVRLCHLCQGVVGMSS